MLCIHRRLLGHPVYIPLTSSVRSQLVATINLGTQLFNPYRFNTVLGTVSQELAHSDSPSQDISDQFKRYMESAKACFKEQSNVSLIGFDQTVSVLRLLSQELHHLPLADEVFETVSKSFFDCLGTANDMEFTTALLALNRERLLNYFSSHHATMITAKAEKIKSARCRIRLIEANVNLVNGDAREFLRPVVESSVKKLCQLSEIELAILLSVFPQNQNILDLFETKLSSASKYPSQIVEIMTRIRRDGCPESKELARNLFVQFFADKQVDLLPVQHQIDAAWIGGEQHIRAVMDNLVWRVERDAIFLSKIDTEHVIRLIEVCAQAHIGARESSILLQGASKASLRIMSPADLVGLFRAMLSLPGNAWIEHGELGEQILKNFFHLSAVGMDEKSVHAVWENFVNSVRVTDWSIVKPIAAKYAKTDMLRDKFRSIVDSSTQESRLGNIVVARVLSLCSLSDGVYERALKSLEESGSIPLNLKASSLKPVQIIDLLQRVKSLPNLEWLAEASVSTTVKPTVSESMELLRLFAEEHKFPATQLINLISSEISNLSLAQFLDFVHYSAISRCFFPPEKLVEYMGLVDLRGTDPVRVVDCVEDLSSLGMLRTEGVASRLITSFTSNSSYKNLSTSECAELSARLLSSLFVSLVIPSTKHLSALCSNMNGHKIDRFDKEIIAEFSRSVDDPSLQELVQGWTFEEDGGDNESSISVLPEETMLHPCQELTQLKKFKLLVRKQTNSKLVSWISHT